MRTVKLLIPIAFTSANRTRKRRFTGSYPVGGDVSAFKPAAQQRNRDQWWFNVKLNASGRSLGMCKRPDGMALVRYEQANTAIPSQAARTLVLGTDN